MSALDVKLVLYNDALRMVGERKIASLSENREPRRLLDSVWDSGAVDYVLEKGEWIFATRRVSLTYTPDITVPFGYTYAFDRPTDMKRLTGFFLDETFNVPNLQYLAQGQYYFANNDTIYLSYVSNDDLFGGDITLWPENFKKYVASYFAYEISPRINNGADRERLRRDMQDYLASAQSKDAMNQPTKFMPRGSWGSARAEGSLTQNNRFNRGQI